MVVFLIVIQKNSYLVSKSNIVQFSFKSCNFVIFFLIFAK